MIITYFFILIPLITFLLLFIILYLAASNRTVEITLIIIMGLVGVCYSALSTYRLTIFCTKHIKILSLLFIFLYVTVISINYLFNIDIIYLLGTLLFLEMYGIDHCDSPPVEDNKTLTEVEKRDIKKIEENKLDRSLLSNWRPIGWNQHYERQRRKRVFYNQYFKVNPYDLRHHDKVNWGRISHKLRHGGIYKDKELKFLGHLDYLNKSKNGNVPGFTLNKPGNYKDSNLWFYLDYHHLFTFSKEKK